MFTDLLDSELGTAKYAVNDYRYNCPFCGDDTKHKLYVRVEEGHPKNNLWHCFRCGNSGNPVSFVMKYYHVSFPEALSILEGYGYRFNNKNYIPKSDKLTDEEYLLLLLDSIGKPKQEEELLVNLTPPPLPQGFKLLSQNLKDPEAYPFLAYCHNRGFTLNDIYTHNIGYVIHSWVPLGNGKSVKLDNHLVFLTHDMQGNYQYWNTRAIGESFVKSLNAPSSDTEYSKKNTIFNLNRAVKTPQVVITEGVPDALTVGESGVGTFGKQVTDNQVQLIIDNITEEQKVYIYLDKDAKTEMKKLAEKLYRQHEETYLVISPTSKDANSLGREKAWEIINNYSVKADGVGLIKLML